MFTFLQRISVYLLIVSLFSSCEKEKVEDANRIKIYTGPVAIAENVETVYSDSARLKLSIKAPLQTEFQTGDREFPKGIEIEFYSLEGQKTTRLTANYARYDKQAAIYIGIGNVVVENFKEKQKMQSEELKFNHIEKTIFTDKFVRVTTPTDVMTGDGLTANQDFSSYKIKRPRIAASR